MGETLCPLSAPTRGRRRQSGEPGFTAGQVRTPYTPSGAERGSSPLANRTPALEGTPAVSGKPRSWT